MSDSEPEGRALARVITQNLLRQRLLKSQGLLQVFQYRLANLFRITEQHSGIGLEE